MLNRTGSSWLCEMLNQSGLGYHADEWFNPKKSRLEFEPTDEGRAEHWRRLVEEHAACGQRIVIKCNMHQIMKFQPFMEPETIRDSRFVFLRRENLLDQAISQFLLELRECPNADTISIQSIVPQRIVELLDIYTRGNEHWRKWLEQNSSHVTHVFYESMVEKPLPTLRQVISHLDSPALLEDMRLDVAWSEVSRRNEVPFAENWREAVRRFQAGDAGWRAALDTPGEGLLFLS